MKKRIVISFIGISMCLTLLIGCRSRVQELSNEATAEETTQEEVAEAPAVSENQEATVSTDIKEEAVEEPEEELEELEMPSPLCILKNSTSQMESGSATGVTYVTGSMDTIKLAPKSTIEFAKDASDFPKLAESIDSLMTALKEEYDAGYKNVSDLTLDPDINEDWLPYFYEMNVSVPRADTEVVSILVQEGDFTGGAHPNSSIATYCFDTKTGNRLKISDVFTDTKDLPKLIKNGIDKEVILSVEDDYFKKAVKDNNIGFIITNAGVTFMFSPYEVAPYAAGTVTSTISFAGHEDIIKREYANTMPSYAANIMQAISYEDYVVSGNSIDNLYVYASSYSGGNKFSDITISCKDAINTQEIEYATDVEFTYIEYVDAGRIIYAEAVDAKGGVTLYVWKVNTDKGTIEFVDKFPNMGSPMYPETIDGVDYYELPVHPEGFMLEKAGRQNEYVVGEDGIPFIPEQ